MIKTVSQLLDAFLEKERQILDLDPVTHPPTIGAMYEGLAKDVLDRALPVEDLVVGSGFAVDDKRNTSKQLDCVLARSFDEEIPHTSTGLRTHRPHGRDPSIPRYRGIGPVR